MLSAENLVPEFLIERSFVFKTTVLVAGILLLYASTLLRPRYPRLWVIPFLLSGLVEWLIVVTVYIEISQIEEDIDEALSEIREVQAEVERTRSDVFSSFSDSDGGFDSLEDRVSDIENELDGHGRRPIGRQVSELEDKVEKIKRR